MSSPTSDALTLLLASGRSLVPYPTLPLLLRVPAAVQQGRLLEGNTRVKYEASFLRP